MTKLLLLAAGLLLIPHLHATTPDIGIDLVVAIDLTKSVATIGPEGKTDFQKNVDGVTGLLTEVPAGAQVTVIGITDRSFAQPYIVLSASVPADQGYFGERLGTARGELVRVWKLRSSKLLPTFRETDILGALFLASQIFAEHTHAQSKMFVLFSDMRQHTQRLDLESSLDAADQRGKGNGVSAAHPDLSHVEVYALGVDGAGRPMSYWQSIRHFWAKDFTACGASLRVFSPLRELPPINK